MSKINKKFIVRGIIFFTIIMATLFIINSFIIYCIPNFRFNRIEQLNYNQNVDILIIGNSHAEEGINSNYISSITNSNVCNFSFSQQESAAVYYSLYKLFKKNQPKIVILEAYTLIQDVEGAYDYMHLSFEKIKYYKMLGKEADFSDVFLPIVRLHNFWANPKFLCAIKNNLDNSKHTIKSHFNPKIMSYKAIDRHRKYNSKATAKHLKLNRLNNILEIKSLCNKNGAKLVLTMLPWYKTLVKKLDYKDHYYSPIKNFCYKNQIPFFDMNIDSDINWDYYYFREQDYTQNTHHNAYGQHVASCELAYYLDSIDEDITATKNYPKLTGLKEFLCTININNDILLIDTCPLPIDLEVFQSAKDELERLGISPSKELGKDIDIQHISNGVKYHEFNNYKSLNPEDLAVNIYELDKETKEIVRHAVARWDVFDTVFLMNP